MVACLTQGGRTSGLTESNHSPAASELLTASTIRALARWAERAGCTSAARVSARSAAEANRRAFASAFRVGGSTTILPSGVLETAWAPVPSSWTET